MNLPSGTITFLFTDIEGSTRLWESQPEQMLQSLARHDALMRHAVERNDGYVFKTIGDAFCAAFHTAPEALQAAFDAQIALGEEQWPIGAPLQVRVAVHTGAAEVRDNDYFGPPLNRVARILSTAHGGQVLLSDVSHDLCRDALPNGCTLRPLGEHRLKDLGRPESVFQLCHPALRSDFPALRSLENLPNNLPEQLTSFVGREAETIKIKDLLAKARLLTLTGSGGCGKTRLSLQVAAEVLDTFHDGAWLVELAPVSDPELVPRTVAGVLGLKDEPGAVALQRLKEFLKERRLVLVLDNCEHLLDVCARFADEILRHCPEVSILASSREGLGIAGEVTFRVPSLSLPSDGRSESAETLAQYEAVRLFVDRALANNPKFAVTNQNAPAVASVCQRLDGIPLAIELAAARLRSMSVEEVNQRLDQRFRLLTGGSRTALPRQQTLRSLIDWSYDLLNGSEKALLCRLSVFSGGWTLEAAERVCAGDPIEDWDVLDLLSSLADKSLVVAEERAGVTRYLLLETVRQYARDRMLESGAAKNWRDAHLEYFHGLLADISPRMPTEFHATFGLLDREKGNLRSALSWSLDGEGDRAVGLSLAAHAYWFWYVRGYLREGLDWLEKLLSSTGEADAPRARIRALRNAGMLAGELAEYSRAIAYLDRSLALAEKEGAKAAAASALEAKGIVFMELADFEPARDAFEEALVFRRSKESNITAASVLTNLAESYALLGHVARAGALFAEAMAIFEQEGRPRGVAHVTHWMGTMSAISGDSDMAKRRYEESIAARRELRDARGTADSLASLAFLLLDSGEWEAASDRFCESFKIHAEIGVRKGQAQCLEGLGDLASLEDPLAAARIWGSAEKLREEIGSKPVTWELERQEKFVSAALASSDGDAFARSWAEGRFLSAEKAFEYRTTERAASSQPSHG